LGINYFNGLGWQGIPKVIIDPQGVFSAVARRNALDLARAPRPQVSCRKVGELKNKSLDARHRLAV
jgi:hypothetical protein